MPTITKVTPPATVIKQAVPILAYYEIFKRYFANKQEEKAWVIKADETGTVGFAIVTVNHAGGTSNTYTVTNTTTPMGTVNAPIAPTDTSLFLGAANGYDNPKEEIYLKFDGQINTWMPNTTIKASALGAVREDVNNNIEIAIAPGILQNPRGAIVTGKQIGRAHV